MQAQKSKQGTDEPTVETIAPKSMWREICDGVNTIGHDEGVFVFDTDGFECVIKDAANVALISQRVDAADFDSYDVDGRFSVGINTAKLDDVLKECGNVPVSISYDWDTFTVQFRAGDVRYNTSGIDPEQVRGSPADIPPVKEKFPYDIDVEIPVDRFERASNLIELETQIATWHMGGDVGFVMKGAGDVDDVNIAIHEGDGFEWRKDPPEDVVECRQSNKYIQEVVGLLDESTVHVVTGEELPYHLWTTRADVIETKVMQAPRVDSSK